MKNWLNEIEWVEEKIENCEAIFYFDFGVMNDGYFLKKSDLQIWVS